MGNIQPLLSHPKEGRLNNRRGRDLLKSLNHAGSLVTQPYFGFNRTLPHLRDGLSGEFFTV